MELLIVFGVGIVVSFFSSFMSGGLGILSLTSLLAFGLSPHVALGTFRLSSIGFSFGGLYQYIKSGKVVWEHVLPLSLIGVVGAVIGVHLVLQIPEVVLEKVIGFVILLFIPLSVWKPHLGVERVSVSNRSKTAGYVTFFFASIWGGAVAIGTGFMVLYSQMYFFGLRLLDVKGTNRIPVLFKTTVSLAIFGYYSLVNWQIGFIFGSGMFIGSLLGTYHAIKIGDSWMRYILLVTITLFSLKLILGL